MFPYDQKPVSRIRSSKDIEHFGRQSLLRALNIGRVVTFVGSGISLQFDQPKWNDLKDEAKRVFDEATQAVRNKTDLLNVDFLNEYGRKLGPLEQEIQNPEAFRKFETVHFVKLCEDYFEELEFLLKKHDLEGKVTELKSQKKFRKDFAEQFKSVKRDKLRWPKPLSALAGGPEFKSDELDQLLKTYYDPAKGDGSPDTLETFDSCRALYRQLGITRFLTLNYDLEIERILLEEGRTAPKSSHDILQKFVDEGRIDNNPLAQKYDRGPGRAVYLKSASGRVLRSTSSRRETLADLFAFGAFPTNYSNSVHHLHGRVDDPENMILTSSDYQEIYYGKSEQTKSFDEARHAVFTGSDILALGIGYEEADVLKPLRDFLELESDGRDSYGKVYYLTTSKLSGDSDYDTALKNGRAANMALSQELYQTYGMHALFLDFSFEDVDQWDETTSTFFAARCEMAHYKNVCKGKGGLVKWDPRGAPLVDMPELAIARKIIAQVIQTFIDKGSLPLGKLAKKAEQIIDALDQQLRNRGAVIAIKKLSADRNDWWKKWSTRPGLRWAVYGPHRYIADEKRLGNYLIKSENGSAEPLVWRQTNLVANFEYSTTQLGDEEKAPQITQFLRATCKARKKARERAIAFNQKGDGKYPQDHPAAVVRISMPPGSGKGRLTSFFTNKQHLAVNNPDPKRLEVAKFPFQYLFCQENLAANAKTLKENTNVVGCFSAHLTFALEFSSIIVGLVRFLQLHLPSFEKELEQKKSEHAKDKRWTKFKEYQMHEPNDRQPGMAFLKEFFDLLIETCPCGGWSTRVVVMLSYLDRLVDKNGDAYSPIHREFFRLISGWNSPKKHLKLPIDTVLINSYANKPIRYLSIEKPISKKHKRQAKKWTGPNWFIRHDRELALKHWQTLPRISETNVVEEAIYFALTSPPLAKPHTKAVATTKEIHELLKKEGTKGDFDIPKGLKSFVERRVVYTFLFAGLAVELYEHLPDEPGRDAAFQAAWKAHTKTLEAAYTSGRSQGLFDALLTAYRILDRKPGDADPAFKTRNRETLRGHQLESLSARVVDHLALFSHPVPANVLKKCPEISELLRNFEGEKDDKLADVLNKLVRRGLACRYQKFSAICKTVDNCPKHLDLKKVENFVFALDTKLISALRAKADLSVYGHYSLVPFQPSLFPEQGEHSIKPETSHFTRVSQVVRALVKDTHDDLVDKWTHGNSAPRDQQANALKEASDDLRAAYALIRGTFSLSVVSRLGDEIGGGLHPSPFDEYRTWMRKLLNTATLLSQLVAKHRKDYSDADILDINEPFFRDEATWLYNERGLISFVQGRLFDAIPLFGQALTVLGTSSKQDDLISYPATRRRLLLNLALAHLERGHIKRAHDTFLSIVEDTNERWPSDTPSTVNCFARGYLALCQHLSDDFVSANDGYVRVIDEMKELGFTRGQCIFRRHYGDLLRAMSKSRSDEKYLAAINELKTAEELAMGIRAVELQNYILIAQARLHRDMRQRPEALENLRQVEEFARKMGIQKMLTEVLKVRGEVLLAEGEATQAGFVTSQSIAMAKRNGMRLRKISGALIQAEILSTRNQTRDAARLVREILVESQSLGYATKTSTALKLLSRLPS